MPDALYLWLLAALLVGGAVFDVRTRRIPNWLSFGGWVAGLGAHLALGGVGGLVDALLGLGLMLVLTFPLFALSWMGAGDVKLLGAVGAFVTISLALKVLFGVILTGLVVAVLALARHGVLRDSLERFGGIVALSLAGRRPVYLAPSERESIELPYAVVIALGTLASLVVIAYL
jgi:prepilin peptidase CpaA